MSLTAPESSGKRPRTRPSARLLRQPVPEASAFLPSGRPLLPVSPENQRRFASLIRKFHEFVFEFDRDYKLLSIWTANEAISYQMRDGLLGASLQTLAGRDISRFLRLIFRDALRSTGPVTFELRVPIQQAPRWFAAHVYRLRHSSHQAARLVLKVQDITAQHLLEERVRKSELILKHAEEIAEMGTWEYDVATGAVTWSKQLFRLHGLNPSQFPRNLDDLWRILNFKNIEKLRRDFEAAVRSGVPFRFSEPYTLPDGSLRILNGLGAPVADSTGKIVRVVGVTRDITSHARTEANLRWLSHQLLTIRSEEQRRVSRELHETTAQTLAALKMTLAQIGRSIPRRNNRVHRLLRTSADLASAAVREVRFVSSYLHPPMLEETGLVVALASYAKLFTERGGVPVQVRIRKDFGRLENELELTVFRIVQESLTNVHRHARAHAASVRVERNTTTVKVEIKDDGIGIFHVISEASAQVPLGVGIAGIRERVDQLHGEFDIVSAPGAGTAIRATLPINPRRETRHDPKIDAKKRKRRAKTLPHTRRRRPRDRAPRHSRTA